YVGSQNWPFPSQLMVGFVAAYAGGEIAIDADELEDARWFPRNALPGLPSRHSISRFIIDHYGRSARRTADAGPARARSRDRARAPGRRDLPDRSDRGQAAGAGSGRGLRPRPPRRDRRRRDAAGAGADTGSASLPGSGPASTSNAS